MKRAEISAISQSRIPTAEFSSRDVEFSERLKDTHDGLRFELKDADGYVLFFGGPR